MMTYTQIPRKQVPLAVNRNEAPLRDGVSGSALWQLGRLPEAAKSCLTTLLTDRANVNALHGMGAALFQIGNYTDAAALIAETICLSCTSPIFYSNMGITLTKQGQFQSAVRCFRRAVTLSPNLAAAHFNMALALAASAYSARRNLVEAKLAIARAIAIEPASADSNWAYRHILLAGGEFMVGWKFDEIARRIWEHPALAGHFHRKWSGEPLAGRTIVLHGEDGFGDQIQFARYAPILAELGARVIWRGAPELGRLMSTLPGVSEVPSAMTEMPPCDFHLRMTTALYVLKTTADNVPRNVPCLRSEANKSAFWGDRLRKFGPELRVGLAWAGSQLIQERNMRLEELTPLAGVEGVTYFSLQKGPSSAAEETSRPPPGMKLIDLTADISDWSDTAAFVENLDLLITVDTAVAHLAGALAKPVWMLDRFAHCWRWMPECEDSPWYPTMRIFRQCESRAWAPVIDRVAEELQTLVSERARPACHVSSGEAPRRWAERLNSRADRQRHRPGCHNSAR